LSYFIPLNSVPVFGSYLANQWLWSVNFSPAYVGQGIIMGPQTTFSMLLGALIGYAILSPIAQIQGWAPGRTDDWKNGSKGWVVWVSLAIMLADSLVNLAWMLVRPLVQYVRVHVTSWKAKFQSSTWNHFAHYMIGTETQYSVIDDEDGQSTHRSVYSVDEVTPVEHMISNRTTLIGLVLSCIACIIGVHYTFGNMIPFTFTILALIFAMLLSIMGVRALGETDLNPVSGISKLTQLVFAFFTPKGNKNAIIINLIAGALSESGALQAGDLMQDLKAGHLIGASPKAQFYGQIIGSAVGAVVSAVVYKLYTNVYDIPGTLFEYV
jgi:OPT family oligopeptide transporter